MKNIDRYLKKHRIDPEHVLSVHREGRNTMLSLDSGEEVSTTLSMYEVSDFLPEDAFVSICRGILVRRDAILAISDDGVYTTIDGKTFQGRKRYLSEHKKLRKELGLTVSSTQEKSLFSKPAVPLSLLEKCSLLDDMPMAYCVIELVFDEGGHGIDFIFRYCNKYMEIVEGVPVEAMVNHSFYEVFQNGDRKWLVAYADVALNGVQRILHDYSPEIDKYLTIYCYQPEPGYCACILAVEEPLTPL